MRVTLTVGPQSALLAQLQPDHRQMRNAPKPPPKTRPLTALAKHSAHLFDIDTTVPRRAINSTYRTLALKRFSLSLGTTSRRHAIPQTRGDVAFPDAQLCAAQVTSANLRLAVLGIAQFTRRRARLFSFLPPSFSGRPRLSLARNGHLGLLGGRKRGWD